MPDYYLKEKTDEEYVLRNYLDQNTSLPVIPE